MFTQPRVTILTLPRDTPRPTPIASVSDAAILTTTITAHTTHVAAPQTAPAIIVTAAIPNTVTRVTVTRTIPISTSRVIQGHHDTTTAASIAILLLPVVTSKPAMVMTAALILPVWVAGGVVILALRLGTSDGVDGGGVRDEAAAASTTAPVASALTARSATTPSAVRPLVSSSAWAILIDDRNGAMRIDGSSLLQMVISLMDNVSMRGSGGVSGVALGVSRITAHIPHPPTAAGCRSARRSGGRPATSVKIHLTATPPRPAPASLLPSSMRPQRGRIAPERGRVGRSLRADEKTANRRSTTGGMHTSEGALVLVAVVMQEKEMGSAPAPFSRHDTRGKGISLRSTSRSTSHDLAACTHGRKKGNQPPEDTDIAEGSHGRIARPDEAPRGSLVRVASLRPASRRHRGSLPPTV